MENLKQNDAWQQRQQIKKRSESRDFQANGELFFFLKILQI